MNQIALLENDLLLKVAKGEKVDRPPVWIMRQAGRYLPEYMAVRKQAGSFRAMIENPELAAEVTIQPIDLIGVDAAIIFSDILVIPEAIGLPYEMIPGKGPFFPNTVRSASELKKLHPIAEESNLDDTYAALKLVKKELAGRVPLIGFAGAPWTIFCYMTEGSGSKTFSVPKSILYQDPVFSHNLLEKITEATITYLKGQIAAGVDIVQIFDSWAGILHKDTYMEFAFPYIQRICNEIQEVPKIVFAKGAFYALEELAKLDCHVIGLDWQTQPSFALDRVSKQALQGNLDPCLVYAPDETIVEKTEALIRSFPKGRHIVNLGHGMYPDMKPEKLKLLVQTVKQFRYDS